jgi:hypothetical protein
MILYKRFRQNYRNFLISKGIIPRPLGRKAGEGGFVLPAYSKISRRNLQIPRPLWQGASFIFSRRAIMDDTLFTQTLETLKGFIQKNPENENYQKILEVIIQKKAEYDLERLKGQREFMNNLYQLCLQDVLFKHHMESLPHEDRRLITCETEGIKLIQ